MIGASGPIFLETHRKCKSVTVIQEEVELPCEDCLSVRTTATEKLFSSEGGEGLG